MMGGMEELGGDADEDGGGLDEDGIEDDDDSENIVPLANVAVDNRDGHIHDISDVDE